MPIMLSASLVDVAVVVFMVVLVLSYWLLYSTYVIKFIVVGIVAALVVVWAVALMVLINAFYGTNGGLIMMVV